MTKTEKYVLLICVVVVSLYGLAVRQYSINEDRKLADHEILMKEIEEYRKCNGDLACQYLYPKAQEAIADAKAKAAKNKE